MIYHDLHPLETCSIDLRARDGSLWKFAPSRAQVSGRFVGALEVGVIRLMSHKNMAVGQNQ